MNDYRWSLGTLIGLPAAILGCLALVGCIWLARRWAKASKDDPYGEHGIALTAYGAAALSLVLAVGGVLWGMWPYEGEYHQWRETSGEVQRIDSRLLAGGNGGMSERFVVTFADGLQRSCDDTRCAQVEAGDHLTIACKRLWQWAGTHGYDCNYVEHEPPNDQEDDE